MIQPTVTVVATLEWILVRIDASAKDRTFSPIMGIEHGTDALGVIPKLMHFCYTKTMKNIASLLSGNRHMDQCQQLEKLSSTCWTVSTESRLLTLLCQTVVCSIILKSVSVGELWL